MTLRLFCAIFLIISACAFPLFFTAAVGLFAIIWFRDYYEIIPVMFLHDVLYGISLHRFFSFSYVMTLTAVALVLISVFVRRQMLDTRGRSM